MPVRLNTNENPYPLAGRAGRATSADGAAASRGRRSTATPTGTPSRCATDLAAYLPATAATPVAPEQVWAANGSNEVLQQLLQAFGGPGRTALGFTPSYSMHPMIAARHRHRAGSTAPRGADFALDRGSGRGAGRASTARTSSSSARPNNPTGTALALDVDRGRATTRRPGMVVVDEAYAEFARAGHAVAR